MPFFYGTFQCGTEIFSKKFQIQTFVILSVNWPKVLQAPFYVQFLFVFWESDKIKDTFWNFLTFTLAFFWFVANSFLRKGLSSHTRIIWKSAKKEKKIEIHLYHVVCKGQKKPKADWRAIDSSQKRTNEFVLFAFFLLFTANKSNSFVHCLGESMARQSCFRFYLTITGKHLSPLFLVISKLINKLCLHHFLETYCLSNLSS